MGRIKMMEDRLATYWKAVGIMTRLKIANEAINTVIATTLAIEADAVRMGVSQARCDEIRDESWD